METISHCLSNDENTTKYLWRLWNDHPKYQLPGSHNWLIGYSWAALRTNFIVGKIMLDAGLSTNISVDHIFLTHGHSDHSASLYFNLFTPNKKIYVPIQIKSIVERFLLCHFEISVPNMPFDPVQAGYEVIGCKPGDMFELINNGKNHRVHIYESDHSVPCLSFGFEEEGKSLKEEYRGLSGKELGSLRKQGMAIESYIWHPRYIYIGDTSEKVFDMNPDIFRYLVIIIECTFLYDDDLEQASITKHCHWRTLKPIIQNHPDNLFVLYHFSTRYKESEIIQFFEQNAKDVRNIHPWTHS
jgi:ribonuclease Z